MSPSMSSSRRLASWASVCLGLGLLFVVALGGVDALPTRLQRLSSNHALVENEAQVVVEPLTIKDAWAYTLQYCPTLTKTGAVTGCGFGMLAELYEDIHSAAGKAIASTWPPKSATWTIAEPEKPKVIHATNSAALRTKVQNRMGVAQYNRPINAAVLVNDEEKSDYSNILTKKNVEDRVKFVFTKDWKTSIDLPGTQNAGSAEETTSRFRYTFNEHSQLERVSGNVIHGPSTDASDGGFCAALWLYKSGGTDAAAVENDGKKIKSDRINDQGHIVAASLGGSNKRVQNFFPQIGWSNRGQYYYAEQVAQFMRKTTQAIPECVRIDIQFGYPAKSSAEAIPTGGTYTVDWKQDCAVHTFNCRYTVAWKNEYNKVLTVAQVNQYVKDQNDPNKKYPGDQKTVENSPTLHYIGDLGIKAACEQQFNDARYVHLQDTKEAMFRKDNPPTAVFDRTTVLRQPDMKATAV